MSKLLKAGFAIFSLILGAAFYSPLVQASMGSSDKSPQTLPSYAVDSDDLQIVAAGAQKSEVEQEYRELTSFEQKEVPPQEILERWEAFAKKWRENTTYLKKAKENIKNWKLVVEFHERFDTKWETLEKAYGENSNKTTCRQLQALLNEVPETWHLRDHAIKVVKDCQAFLSGKKVPPRVKKKIPAYYKSPRTGMEFMLVKAGTFIMGASKNDRYAHKDEIRHSVTFPHSFLMGKTEVTQSQWYLITGSYPSTFQKCGKDCPVENVSWYDAVQFCNQMSDRDGLQPCYQFKSNSEVYWDKTCTGYRLPTEAEWEFAARAGTDTMVYSGDFRVPTNNDGPNDLSGYVNLKLSGGQTIESKPSVEVKDLNPIAWYLAQSAECRQPRSAYQYKGSVYASRGHGLNRRWYSKTYYGRKRRRAMTKISSPLEGEDCGPRPVAQKLPNAWGFYDMIGNVQEWCWDFQESYAASTNINPTGPELGVTRIVRGCGWEDHPGNCRVSERFSQIPTTKVYNLGLRVVRTVH